MKGFMISMQGHLIILLRILFEKGGQQAKMLPGLYALIPHLMPRLPVKFTLSRD